MKGIIGMLDRRWYPDCTDSWDDEMFRARVVPHLNGDSRVLDLGAGAGIVSQMNFRGLAGQVSGIDLDPRVTSNPFLDDSRVASGEDIPYGDNTFDVVLSDNVLEHLPDPRRVFREVARVLRPGGRFLAKTPNKWHYMPTIARMTPHAFHRYYNRLRGRNAEDTFKTLYRANSRRDIRRLVRESGLQLEGVDLIERRPEYLRLNPLTYLFGWAYERFVNSSGIFAGFRILMIVELSKPRIASQFEVLPDR